MPNPQQPERAGWYDDPEHPEQLRYFDGILWTTNVTPRRTRWDAPPPGGPLVTPTADIAPAPLAPPSSPPAGPTEASAGGSNPYAAGSPPSPSSSPSSNPYAAALPPSRATAYGTGPTTKDGVPLASYGLRVAAYIIDNIILGFLSMIAGGWFLWQAIAPVWSQAMAAAEANDQVAMQAAVTAMDAKHLLYFSAVSIFVAIAYNLVFLTRWSATPGKLLLGISVRRVDRPGVIDFGTASRRVAFEAGLSALGNLPLISFLAVAGRVADLLWPLRDPQRQTLHDKFAATVVVQGKATAQGR